MRPWKRYLPPLATLLLIVLGAAMPWLASQIQDVRLSKLQEDLELNAVNLTLQKGDGVELALEIISKEYTALPWAGETRMTASEVLDAAMEVFRYMHDYQLLSDSAVSAAAAASPEVWMELVLVVAEDGSTVLVWYCFWPDPACMVTVDDASGKAVQFQVGILKPRLWPDADQQKEAVVQWQRFFQDYYGIELLGLEEQMEQMEDAPLVYQYQLLAGGPEEERLSNLYLWMGDGYLCFNM